MDIGIQTLLIVKTLKWLQKEAKVKLKSLGEPCKLRIVKT